MAQEFGWRGYALPRMEADRNAFVSSAMLGVFWGLCHLPLFWLPGSSQNAIASGVSEIGFLIVLFIVELTGLSVIMAWVFNNTRGSVLLALLFHASLNSTTAWLTVAKLMGSVFSGELESYAISVLITWIIAGVIVAIAGPKRLKRMTGDK